jgi:putative membrane protein
VMVRILGYLIINAIAVLIAGYILPGINIDNIWTAVIIAVVLGVINAVIRPILVILTLPITILTLGLFILVINALLVLLVSNIVPGFTVDGFWWAMLFSIVLSLVSWFLNAVAGGQE